ncbi:MAG: transaldolase [Alphaproteobacteria bacterium]|nr:transaldolase [Alphaproteobacteria bacterium]
MHPLSDLKIAIYADGADKQGILELYQKPYIKGLTTNPTLMRKAGITDYEAFAREILEIVIEKPLSLEVFSDEFSEMKRQAKKINSWGKNVYVKIPITNSHGASALPLIRELSQEGLKLNITALLTLKQVEEVIEILNENIPSIISIFAGRIADTGVDPMPIMRSAKTLLKPQSQVKLLWASVREILNIVQAEQSRCDIVTVQHDILAKAATMLGRDLTELSLETVRMFMKDAEVLRFVL